MMNISSKHNVLYYPPGETGDLSNKYIAEQLLSMLEGVRAADAMSTLDELNLLYGAKLGGTIYHWRIEEIYIPPVCTTRRCPEWIMKWFTNCRWINRVPKILHWLYPTLHFCYEWDGLAIDEHCREFDCCSCLKVKDAPLPE